MRRIFLVLGMLMAPMPCAAQQVSPPPCHYKLGKTLTVGATNARYKTVGAAMTAASAGDEIFVSPGTYNEQVTMKAGTILSGWGPGPGNDDAVGTWDPAQHIPGTTVINWDGSGHGHESSALYVGNGCVVRNISVVAYSTDTVVHAIGGADSDAAHSNILFENCFLYGDGDIVWTKSGDGVSGKPFYNLVMRDCYLMGGYDGIMIPGTGTFYNCHLRINNTWNKADPNHPCRAIKPGNADSPGILTFYGCDFEVNGGQNVFLYEPQAVPRADVVTFYNCRASLTSTDSASLYYAKGAHTHPTGTVTFYGGSLTTSSGNGANFAIDLDQAAGGTINVHGLKYSTSSGTITGSFGVSSSALTMLGGFNYKSVACAATVDGSGTGTIADAGMLQFVAVTSDNAAKMIILPTPTPGTSITLGVGANGYELASSAPGTVGINGGVGAGKKSTIAADTMVQVLCTSATTWQAIKLTGTTLAAVEAAH